jgi:ADP-heptose:LPS heptosyltransferase
MVVLRPPVKMIEIGDVPDARIGVFVPGDGLGDGVMRIPFLHALRKRWPEHRIWWVTAGPTAMSGALREYAAPYIERIHTGFHVEKPRAEMLRKCGEIPFFDIVFNFYTRMSSVLLLKWMLAPRLHYASLALQLGSSHRDPSWVIARPKHMLARIRSMATAAGCDLPLPKGVFPVGPGPRLAAARLIPCGRRAIGFAAGSGNSAIRKNWPLERFIAVARQRAELGDLSVFLIGPSERPFAERIRSALPEAILAELDRPDAQTGATGIELTLAIGERLTAAVMNDSGLAHVLAIADVPQVVLYGPTNPSRWAPNVRPLRFVRARDFGSDEVDAIPDHVVEVQLADLLAQVTAPRLSARSLTQSPES